METTTLSRWIICNREHVIFSFLASTRSSFLRIVTAWFSLGEQNHLCLLVWFRWSWLHPIFSVRHVTQVWPTSIATIQGHCDWFRVGMWLHSGDALRLFRNTDCLSLLGLLVAKTVHREENRTRRQGEGRPVADNMLWALGSSRVWSPLIPQLFL